MRFRLFGLLSLALATCLATSLIAQDEGGRQRGGRQRGGPGGGFGGGFGGGPGGFRGGPGMGGGGALELVGLLRDEKVREEVGMDDATYEAASTAIREATEKMGEQTRPLFQEMRDASESERAELRKKMEEQMKVVNQTAQEVLDEVLLPDEQKRLMGLLVQRRGMSAVLNELVAKQIGLDEQGKEKVSAAMEEQQSGTREKMREMMQSGDREGMREKMREMMEKAREDGDKAISGALSAEQRKKLEDLKGKEFEFSEEQAGFGRGGPGGFGRGGAAGGGRGGRGGPGGQGGGRRGGGNDN